MTLTLNVCIDYKSNLLGHSGAVAKPDGVWLALGYEGGDNTPSGKNGISNVVK